MGCFLCNCIGGIFLTIFRWATFLANLIFIVTGGALITIGTIIYIYTEEWSEFYSENAQIAAIVCIVAGCCTFAIAFLGFFGAKNKTPWMLYIYSGLLFVTCSITLAGGICAFEYDEYFAEQVNVNMVELMKRYPAPGAGGDNFAKDTWDQLHSGYHCCGINNITDWIQYRPELNGYPDSCKCIKDSEGCGLVGLSYYFDTGCYTKLQPYLSDLVDALGGLAIGVAMLQLGTGIISICLANAFRRRRSEGNIS